MLFKLIEPVTFYNCQEWTYQTPQGRTIKGYSILILDPETSEARRAVIDLLITPEVAEKYGLLTPEGVAKYYLKKIFITGHITSSWKGGKALKMAEMSIDDTAPEDIEEHPKEAFTEVNKNGD